MGVRIPPDANISMDIECAPGPLENQSAPTSLSGPYKPRLREEKRGSAPLAQLAEHLTLNQAVEGSIPSLRIVNVIHGRDRIRFFIPFEFDLGPAEGFHTRNLNWEWTGPSYIFTVSSIKFGRVLELVDRIDLGSIGVTPREGSSPSSPIVFYNSDRRRIPAKGLLLST